MCVLNYTGDKMAVDVEIRNLLSKKECRLCLGSEANKITKGNSWRFDMCDTDGNVTTCITYWLTELEEWLEFFLQNDVSFHQLGNTVRRHLIQNQWLVIMKPSIKHLLTETQETWNRWPLQ